MRDLMSELRRSISALRRRGSSARGRTARRQGRAPLGNTAGKTADTSPISWRSRVVLPTVVAVCAGITGIAVTGAGHSTPGLRFVQAGHWIYNSALGSAFHIDGGSKNIDAEVEIPGASGAATVVQTDRRGYVLSRDQIVAFGKSDLSVADPIESPANERPVGLEAADAAFAVYQDAGKIVRFGERPVTESAGGRISSPLVTRDGTLWVRRVDGGELCRLPAEATRMTCTASTPAGHSGALTLVGEQLTWVDTTADTMRAVSKDGLGRPAPLGVDLPDSTVIAANDLGGRVAAVDPDQSVVHLVDAASALAGDVAEPPVSAEVTSGQYEQIASTGTTLALLDENTGTVVTLDRGGDTIRTAKIPGSPNGGGEGEPTLFRGADSRLYVDSATGQHVMVVGDGGDVTTVPADGVPEERAGPKPTSSPSSPSPEKTTQSPTPDRVRDRTTQPPPPPPSRPGAPDDVSGTAGNGSVTVTWEAAPDNGSPITSYVLSWSGGSTQVSGSDREATITGLDNGSGYVVTVSAVNGAGRGPGVSTERLYPGGRAEAPRSFDVSRTSADTYTFSWRRPSLEGGDLIEYRVDNGQSAKQTTGTSLAWKDLTDGRKYTVTVRAITRSPSGEVLTGKPAELSFTVDLGPQILANKGTPLDYNDSCQADNGCAYVEFEATGLEPNAEYTYTAYGSEWDKLNSVTLNTDENGYEHETEQFATDPVGQKVWVVAEGPGGPIKSDKFVWRK